jgi:hypothetical protein
MSSNLKIVVPKEDKAIMAEFTKWWLETGKSLSTNAEECKAVAWFAWCAAYRKASEV